MTTTVFAPFTDVQTTLSGSSAIKFDTVATATLRGQGRRRGQPRQREGGVWYADPNYTGLNGLGAVDGEPQTEFSAVTTLSGVGSFRHGYGGEASFRQLVSIGGKAYAIAAGSFLPFVGEASDPLPVPQYAFAESYLFPMLGGGTGLTGEIGVGVAVFRALDSLSGNKPYGEAEGVFRPMAGSAHAYIPPYELQWTEIVNLTTPFDGLSTYNVVMTVELSLDVSVIGGRVTNYIIPVELSLDYSISNSVELNAVISEELRIVSAIAREVDADVWSVTYVLEPTVNDEYRQYPATTRYADFEFNSLCKYKGQYYGVRSDGLYQIGAETDDGKDIESQVVTGHMNFGSDLQKRVESLYIGGRIPEGANVSVKVDEGKPYYYKTTQNSPLGAARTPLGKGLRGRYYQVALSTTTTSDIEDIGVNVVATDRRV